MIYTSDETIDRYIKEDVPYGDLTTWVLGIGGCEGRLQFFSREEAVLCGTEEVIRIFGKLNIKPVKHLPSGAAIAKNEVFIEAVGTADNLHKAWKISQNILEYCSGIATRTKKLVDKARNVNPKISVVTTRKVFPGTKELAVKAVLAGGGMPHRLGLSETVLIFKQHLNFIGGLEELSNRIDDIRSKACEKKVIVEVESLEDAIKVSKAGVDGIQFDKVSPEIIKNYVRLIKDIDSRIIVLAAGGINENNVEEYAGTGADAIVTTSVYFGKPVDLGCRMTEI